MTNTTNKPNTPTFHDERLAVAVVDYKTTDAPQKLTDSLKTTGFAVLTNTPVPNDLIQDVYDEWRAFLIRLNKEYTQNRASPTLSSTRSTHTPTDNNNNDDDDDDEPENLAAKYYHNTTTQDGYFPTAVSETAKGATAPDLKHYYQLYFPHGRYPTELSPNARTLYHRLFDLGKTLVSWIDHHLPTDVRSTIESKLGGKTKRLIDCVSSECTMMRILHYPGVLPNDTDGTTRTKQGALRAAPHEDINLITVLPAGSARGLQVRLRGSDEWVEVPLVPGSIVINVGDMMQEMTEGAYVSTTHRVIKMEDEEDDKEKGKDGFGTGDRMSTPCFIHLKRKCPVSERYGSAEHYLKERLVTLGVVPPRVLEEFLERFPGGVVPGWDPAEE